MMPLLAWLERYARTITFQQFSGSRLRAKNRVLLQYSNDRGEVNACGAPTLLAAIEKARLRNRLSRPATAETTTKRDTNASS